MQYIIYEDQKTSYNCSMIQNANLVSLKFLRYQQKYSDVIITENHNV